MTRALRWAVWVAAGVAAAGVARAGPDRSAIEFVVESELGEESAWTKGYLEKAARVLVRLMDQPETAPPKRIAVRLRLDAKSQGIAGAASATELSFESSCWPQERFRWWILAHELTNLLAHHYGGAGGYPSDWWSNGRSPFPLYAAVLVMAHLGHVEEAAWLRARHRGQPDHELFWALHGEHGFELFARFFRALRADRIDLGRIGKPWPYADRARSLYAVAYLSVAADANLAPVFRAHGIGAKPADWDERHPERPFEPYEVTDAAVRKIVEERARLFATKGASAALEAARDRFRRGEAAR